MLSGSNLFTIPLRIQQFSQPSATGECEGTFFTQEWPPCTPYLISRNSVVTLDKAYMDECLPILLSEKSICRFKFWQDGDIREGMRFQNNLYGLLRVLPIEQRWIAYDLTCTYTQRGIDVVLTCNDTYYYLWVNLRSAGLQIV